VNRDMVSLIFSGLLRYNPHTKNVEEDLATLTVSSDRKVYTVTLKDNLFWHDSSEEDPHPVTSDDVLFTFKTIQDPAFPNTLLQRNFRGVTVEQVDEKTVQFRLEEPYYFFPSNLTLGLLPRRSFAGVPIARLVEALSFGFQPVGTGPYRFKSLVQTDLSTEITLERFAFQKTSTHHLEQIVFRIFPNFPSLLSDVGNLDGIRLVPRREDGEFVSPNRFDVLTYSLPQYTALFFNLDREVLRDPHLRLGLQLGTDKTEIAELAHSPLIVDTPFLELDTSDWRYQFDADAAQGALFDSEWYFPEKLRLQRLLEQREANSVGVLQVSPVVLLETGAVLTVTGAYLHEKDTELTLNGLAVTSLGTGSWIVGLPTHGGTGSITLGTNLLRLRQGESIVDSFYVWRTTDTRAYRRASTEQQLITEFLEARTSTGMHMTALDFFLEDGFLRRRDKGDALGTRMNKQGEVLRLTLLTSSSPAVYQEIATVVQTQWKALGVYLDVDVPETQKEFEERLLARDYDVVLFGQSLLDNLDTYPYWHSSAAQRLTGNRSDLRLDAYNLSQYTSFEVDALLELIRSPTTTQEREEALRELRDALRKDVPAIFLYSPEYAYAYRRDVKGIDFGTPALHSDRFLTVSQWFLKQEHIFRSGSSWWSFFPWLFSLFS